MCEFRFELSCVINWVCGIGLGFSRGKLEVIDCIDEWKEIIISCIGRVISIRCRVVVGRSRNRSII